MAEKIETTNMREQLEEFIKKHGWVRPDRGCDGYPAETVWRSEKPDYSKADLTFLKGRSKVHEEGSLALIVENLVKKWEMEMTHLGPEAWTTVDPATYRACVNGKETNGVNAAMKGTYNWLMENTPKHLYDASKHTFESSHQAFQGAFPDGFGWEVVEVFSGPPKVAFTWRHWGTFTGSYEGRPGNGKVIELYGFAVAAVDKNLQIQTLEVYFKPDGFLEALKGVLDPDQLKNGRDFVGSGCPIHNLQNS